VAQEGLVIVTWETAAEINNLGFNLYRAESAEDRERGESGESLTRLNGDLIPSQELGGPLGARYEFVDELVVPSVTYYYWLEMVDSRGEVERYGPVTAGAHRLFLPVVGSAR
jgi:hypothetical protein